MSLSINLDQPESTFSPGSTVSGHVALASRSDEDIATVTISFTGRCKVNIRKHDHYTTIDHRSQGLYFHDKLILYEGGKYTHKAGTYTWPFVFTIRTNADPPKSFAQAQPKRQLNSIGMMQRSRDLVEPGMDEFTLVSPWIGSYDPRPHPMLDSFAFSFVRWPIDADSKIEYNLAAKLERPTGMRSSLFSSKDLDVARLLDVKTTIPKPVNAPRASQTHRYEITFSSLRLLSSKAEGKLSLRDQAQSLIRPSSVPQFKCEISVITAQKIIPGVPVAVWVSLRPIVQAESQLPTQSVFLRRCGVYLLSRTALRDNGQSAIDHTAEKLDRIPLSSSSKSLNIDLLATENSSINLGKLLEVILSPALDTAPGFSTYNIFRGYNLAFEMKLECAGKSVDLNKENIPVQVLPGVSSRENSTLVEPEIAGSSSRPARVDGAAPEGVEREAEKKRTENGELIPPPPEPVDPDAGQLPPYEPREVPDYPGLN